MMKNVLFFYVYKQLKEGIIRNGCNIFISSLVTFSSVGNTNITTVMIVAFTFERDSY